MPDFKKINIIESSSWDALVEKTYGRPYCLQQQEECRDRSIRLKVPSKPDDFENDDVAEIVNGPEMGVSFQAWLTRDPKQKLPRPDEQEDYCLQFWWHRNFYPDYQMVANDLHRRGVLEAGEYFINIA